MIDLSTEEWKEALRLVQAALDAPEDDTARAAAFDYLRCAQSTVACLEAIYPRIKK